MSKKISRQESKSKLWIMGIISSPSCASWVLIGNFKLICQFYFDEMIKIIISLPNDLQITETSIFEVVIFNKF